MRPTRFSAVIVLTGFVLSSPAGISVAPLIDLTFEHSSLGQAFDDAQKTYAGRQIVETPRLSEPAETGYQNYRFTVDYATEYKIDFKSDDAPSRYLLMRITSTPEKEKNVKDKIELNVTHFTDSDYAFDFTTQDEAKQQYLAFDFRLAESYELPYHWTLHMQAHQSCPGEGGKGLKPPFAIHVEPRKKRAAPDGPVNLIFVARDDASEASPPPQPQYRGGYEIFRIANVPRGQWQHMTLGFRPKHKEDKASTEGQIELWYNHADKPAFVWQHDWGYAPCGTPTAVSKFNLKVGIYRRRHATTQEIHFDNIRFGPTKNSVTTTVE